MKKSALVALSAALTSGLEDTNVRNNTGITSFTISQEGMDSADIEVAKGAADQLTSIVDTTFATLSAEEQDPVKLTVSQKAAGKFIAGLAIDPITAKKAMADLKPENGAISTESLDIDQLDMSVLSTESYDGQSITNALYYSIAFNIGAAKQDEFAEAFFPTIVIDPMQSGITIEAEYVSIMKEFSRSITGKSDAASFDQKPLIKAIYDNDLLGSDKNRLVPVLRDENKSLFIDSLPFVDQTSGESITTAPLRLGETVGLLGISQTDAMIAKGVMDNTDTLDRTLNLQRLYFSLSDEVPGIEDPAVSEAVTENFFTDVSILPYSNFTYSTQDHNKDMSLNFSTKGIIIDTSATKIANGELSRVLDALPANHKVKLAVKLHGEANAKTGDISVYGSSVKVTEVINAAGDVIPATSTDYATIVAAFEAVKLTGYTVEAYRTNSNQRTKGTLITSDKFTQVYNVPLRSGTAIILPTNNQLGTDGDASKLSGQIVTTGYKMSSWAVRTIVDFATVLKNLTSNGVNSGVELDGIGRHFVDTYFSESTMDLGDYVDSISSSARKEDIQAALVNKIEEAAMSMFIDSNYGVAYDTLRPGEAKKTVIVGTDAKLKQYICGKGGSTIEIGDFEVKVVSSVNPLVKGKMFISFGVFDDKRNTEANPLQFGCNAYAPTLNTDTTRTDGGAVNRVLNNMPRFRHIINLPVLTVINVADINGVLGKVAVKTIAA
jgi:hypothetical protein